MEFAIVTEPEPDPEKESVGELEPEPELEPKLEQEPVPALEPESELELAWYMAASTSRRCGRMYGEFTNQVFEGTLHPIFLQLYLMKPIADANWGHGQPGQDFPG